MIDMARIARLENLSQIPRNCERQTTRNNALASSADVHLKRSVFIPFLD